MICWRSRWFRVSATGFDDDVQFSGPPMTPVDHAQSTVANGSASDDDGHTSLYSGVIQQGDARPRKRLNRRGVDDLVEGADHFHNAPKELMISARNRRTPGGKRVHYLDDEPDLCDDQELFHTPDN